LAAAIAILRDRNAAGGGALAAGDRRAIDAAIATHSVVADATAGVAYVAKGPHTGGGDGPLPGPGGGGPKRGPPPPPPPPPPPRPRLKTVCGRPAARAGRLRGATARPRRPAGGRGPVRCGPASPQAVRRVPRCPRRRRSAPGTRGSARPVGPEGPPPPRPRRA